jgi:hypothetical protein
MGAESKFKEIKRRHSKIPLFSNPEFVEKRREGKSINLAIKPSSATPVVYSSFAPQAAHLSNLINGLIYSSAAAATAAAAAIATATAAAAAA